MKKVIIFILLLSGGAAIFIFGNPYYTVFPTNRNQSYNFVITLVLLVLSVIIKRSSKHSEYWKAVYSLFIASAANFFLGTGLLNLQQPTMPPLQNLAIDKFSQFLHIVPVIIGLTLISGENLKSIFIKKGNLKRGLVFGLVSFICFGAAGLFIQWESREIFTSIKGAIPLLLLFVFSNAIMEELWFRGIFLKHYDKLVGRYAAILVTSLLFGLSHINATYEFPGGGIIFGLVVFGLGLIGAHSMFKEDGLIGPVLFHAGYDLMIMVSVLNSF
jgi:membrane protease YdiL (CAAX protease family)